MVEPLLDIADARDELLQEVVARVAHVDAEDVRAGAGKVLDRLLLARSRAERGQDLHPSDASHSAITPSASPSGSPSSGTSTSPSSGTSASVPSSDSAPGTWLSVSRSIQLL